jgi:hypothetical protein
VTGIPPVLDLIPVSVRRRTCAVVEIVDRRCIRRVLVAGAFRGFSGVTQVGSRALQTVSHEGMKIYSG